MDIANHGTEGVILHYLIAIILNWLFSIGMIWILIISGTGLIGIVPDLDQTYGALYVSMHKGKIEKWLRWIPAYGLHTLQDRYCHNDEDNKEKTNKQRYHNRWYASKNFEFEGDAKFWEYFVPSQYAEKMWYETFSWVVVILLIIIIIYGNVQNIQRTYIPIADQCINGIFGIKF